MAPQVFETVNKLWAEKKCPKTAIVVFLASPPPAHQVCSRLFFVFGPTNVVLKLMTIVVPFYNGSVEEAKPIFKPLYDLGEIIVTA